MLYLCCCLSRSKPTEDKPEDKSILMEDAMRQYKEEEQLQYDAEHSPDLRLKELAKATLQIRMSIRH
jgi:hypothetical protein